MEKSKLSRAHILLFVVSAAAVLFSSVLYIRGVINERNEEAEYAKLAGARSMNNGGGNSGGNGSQAAGGQAGGGRADGGQAGGGQGAMNPQQGATRRLEEMTKELKLTSEQRTKIQKIQETMAPRLQAIRNDASLSQEKRREKIASVREETDKKIKQVLTTEQKTKYDARQAQRRARFDGMGREGIDRRPAIMIQRTAI